MARPTSIVSLCEEANERSMIEHRVFNKALVLGPAIIAPLERVTLTNSSFAGSPEALFIEVAEDRPIIGAIGLRDVTFSECRFENVGIMGTRESIAQFREGFSESDESSSGASSA
jgi:hypothetical protein